MIIIKYITLNNGIKIPMLGFGTYGLKNTEKDVINTLHSGYRLIDTAQWYNNEKEVGNAIKKSQIPREEIFITSKTITDGYSETIEGVKQSLERLQTNYIDLMVIHWPQQNDIETYKALETCYKEGLIKAIGLSNFNENQCQKIIKNCKIIPAVNQIETHIYWQQKKMHNFLKNNNICHEAYSPFGEGFNDIFKDVTINEIAKKHNKTSAQVMLNFLISEDIIVIPKSSNEERIKENIDIFDFTLTKEDISKIRELDLKKSCSNWPASMKIEKDY